ncbi:GATA zinc finger domain-containing protein 14 [Calliphora vicina]|uniref:GATA zinc finger domain-containing protein 14 n=1 Tax=Calliphora vicina TaxID=7373 RepID=UPI00325A7041
MNSLNNSVDEVVECPLCMEPLEVDDLNFFPCTCGYQICRFCWHRIRTDENELCPACRKEYPENPADFKPLTQEEMIAFKSQKRQRDQQRKQKITENRKHLANVRVVQKNLVFVVGLPPRLADADILKKHEYFGKYGKIHKVVINPSTAYAGVQGPSASAYVTYVHNSDALRAIQSVNNIMIDGRLIKTSLGTTKYCSHFMKNQQCPKGDCMYLHELGDPEASFTKEEMHQGKHQEYEKRLHDVLIASSGTSTCGVSTGSTSSLCNNSKNSENCKMTGIVSSSTPSTSASASTSVTTNNIASSGTTQKEAWPCLSVSPVNQKDSSSNNANKNKKERIKQDKNKNEKHSKTKNNKNNSSGNASSIPLPKEIDLPVIISNSMLEISATNNNSLIEQTSKSKVDKSIENRPNPKKELATSTIVENEIKDFGNHTNAATTTSINLDNNNGGYLCNKIKNDNNITKIDSQRSLSSSSNSSSSCIVTTSENNSIINESISGKSSPGCFNENNLNAEHTKSPIKSKRPLAPSSELHTNSDSNTNKNNLSENCSKPYGYVENLFAENETVVHKTPTLNINNNVEHNLCLNESPHKNRLENNHYNDSLLQDNDADDSISDTMSKLNLFDENSFFSSTTGILQQSMPLKLKQNEETIPNQLSTGTAPNLPDLINGIDGYQNTTNEWEEALKNVMIKTNKQMEEKLQQNLQQQHIQNQSQIKHQEDLHRLQEIQNRNNILSSLSISQLSGAQSDFQSSSNNYLTSSDLSRQSNYLQYQQQQSAESSNDILQNSLFGTNMSKFFDFHKHQQQQKLQQHCLQINGPNNINGGVNDNLHMRPLLENNRLNSQLVDPNCILTSQQQHQKQKLFGKIDQMLCHQTLQQLPSNQQIGSVQTQQNQFVHNSTGDDDLGFDPFIETQKALAELIENEEEQQNVGTTSSNLMPHKQANNLHQPHQQHMMEYMQRARMPPPGFNHVNNFNGYGVVPRIQNNKVMPFMNLSNNYTAPATQHIQHQQQLQIPSNAWGTHLGNFQQHINEQQIRQVNSNQMPSGGNQKGYTGNDWTAMDPAILSFRQFSFPHQTQVTPQIQPQQQELFLQQLAQQQQQTGFNSQSQHLSGGNVGMPNAIMNSQQSSQPHVNANVQGMLEYLKTRQFV